jgi:LmbE family N-acetylglucosaminyl deacetylase
VARLGFRPSLGIANVASAFRIPDVGDRPLCVLAIGCHGDDIEIGCGGTILSLLDARRVDVTWVVLGAADRVRAQEAGASAAAFLSGSTNNVVLGAFRDSHMPYEGSGLKDFFAGLPDLVDPDLIFTHYRHDLHQDHRQASELTWQTFRAHSILEYEVPKWDGDLGSPNVYAPLARDVAKRKIDLLMEHFRTQREKDWFCPEVFDALMRLRAMECRAPEFMAEAFYAHKLTLDLR